MTEPNQGSASVLEYPPCPERLPEQQLEHGRFRARFARGERELDEILRLRFEVFNLELGEGLDGSYASRRDLDPFDAQCHHLLVEDAASGSVVGTYRLQCQEMASAAGGFYAAGEFDLTGMPPDILNTAIETGRACIRSEHRNRQVLFLLWRGLAQYMMKNDKRFLFGCCSLTSQDPAEGLKLYDQLLQQGKVRSDLEVQPLADIRCQAEQALIDAQEEVHLPTLFRTYLRYGAKVCSPPAIDSAFKTIDYLVLLDTEGLSKRTRSLIFG